MIMLNDHTKGYFCSIQVFSSLFILSLVYMTQTSGQIHLGRDSQNFLSKIFKIFVYFQLFSQSSFLVKNINLWFLLQLLPTFNDINIKKWFNCQQSRHFEFRAKKMWRTWLQKFCESHFLFPSYLKKTIRLTDTSKLPMWPNFVYIFITGGTQYCSLFSYSKTFEAQKILTVV